GCPRLVGKATPAALPRLAARGKTLAGHCTGPARRVGIERRPATPAALRAGAAGAGPDGANLVVGGRGRRRRPARDAALDAAGAVTGQSARSRAFRRRYRRIGRTGDADRFSGRVAALARSHVVGPGRGGGRIGRGRPVVLLERPTIHELAAGVAGLPGE